MRAQHQLILEEARRRGYVVEELDSDDDRLQASLLINGVEHSIVNGTPRTLVNPAAEQIFDNKQHTKVGLARLNIPHPESIPFRTIDDPGIEVFLRDGKSYVCKPSDGTEGEGVELHLNTLEDVRDYWIRNHSTSVQFMLEEQVEGRDIRLQVVDGIIVAACTREPAFVIGDGNRTLLELVTERRAIVRHQNTSNDLIIDEASRLLLSQQNIALEDIPGQGHKVRLKEVANMSQGAVAVDVTDRLHSRYQHWIDKISKHYETGYYAVDIISIQGPEADPVDHSVLLEINARPEWMHHTFSEQRHHDMAGIILDALI